MNASTVSCLDFGDRCEYRTNIAKLYGPATAAILMQVNLKVGIR